LPSLATGSRAPDLEFLPSGTSGSGPRNRFPRASGEGWESGWTGSPGFPNQPWNQGIQPSQDPRIQPWNRWFPPSQPNRPNRPKVRFSQKAAIVRLFGKVPIFTIISAVISCCETFVALFDKNANEGNRRFQGPGTRESSPPQGPSPGPWNRWFPPSGPSPGTALPGLRGGSPGRLGRAGRGGSPSFPGTLRTLVPAPREQRPDLESCPPEPRFLRQLFSTFGARFEAHFFASRHPRKPPQTGPIPPSVWRQVFTKIEVQKKAGCRSCSGPSRSTDSAQTGPGFRAVSGHFPAPVSTREARLVRVESAQTNRAMSHWDENRR
jgi:hypothetical protein